MSSSLAITAARKATQGRRKKELKPIESPKERQVCFSKRRKGLFKKAEDLCRLCNAEVAAVAFSPGGKAFCFGCPSVESLLSHFLSNDNGFAGAGGASNAAAAVMVSSDKAPWWEADISGMSIEELKAFEVKLVELRAGISQDAEMLPPGRRCAAPEAVVVDLL